MKKFSLKYRFFLPRRFLIVVAAIALLGAGCASMGPKTIGRDRLDYDQAITHSWQRQLLMNLVKLRYGDTPFFLDVASITNSYGIETQINLTATWWGNPFGAGASNSQGIGAYGRYSDKPTVTYTPLLGHRFTRSLMTPIPPGTVVSLIQAGWAADAVMLAMVSSVNGVQNRFGGGGRARGADPDFYRLAAALRQIQASGAVGMRVERIKEQEWAVMTLTKNNVSEALKQNQLTVREVLGLKKDLKEFRVVYGSVPRSDEEIAMVTRSMLEILADISAAIEVPQAHIDEGRTMATRVFESDGPGGYRPLIQVKSGPQPPDNPFVAVPYRGRWFWVDDGDLQSKQLFSFLLILISLNDVDPGKGTPLITIPAN